MREKKKTFGILFPISIYLEGANGAHELIGSISARVGQTHGGGE